MNLWCIENLKNALDTVRYLLAWYHLFSGIKVSYYSLSHYGNWDRLVSCGVPAPGASEKSLKRVNLLRRCKR